MLPPSQDHPSNREKPVVIQNDASEYGLSAALIHNGCPIDFVSKSLPDAESRYTNIAWLCLSVCFGLEKFHTYIYGRHITVQIDYRPLEMIQNKPIHANPHRLQCMLLQIQKYSYIIQYKPGNNMVLDDGLRKFPSHKENIPFTLHQHIDHISFSHW